MLSEYEIKGLLDKLMNLYSHSMESIYAESKYNCFIDAETFEKHKSKIWMLNGYKVKIREALNKLKKNEL